MRSAPVCNKNKVVNEMPIYFIIDSCEYRAQWGWLKCTCVDAKFESMRLLGQLSKRAIERPWEGNQIENIIANGVLYRQYQHVHCIKNQETRNVVLVDTLINTIRGYFVHVLCVLHTLQSVYKRATLLLVNNRTFKCRKCKSTVRIHYARFWNIAADKFVQKKIEQNYVVCVRVFACLTYETEVVLCRLFTQSMLMRLQNPSIFLQSVP